MSIPPYELRRTARRTLSVEVSRDAILIAHAPLHMPKNQIDAFIEAHSAWIREKLQRARARCAAMPPPSDAEIVAYKEKAFAVLSKKTADYAAKMGVTYTRIGITDAKGRFGSCSAKGSINYSWRLMRYPEAAWDYVVVHELCHLLHFDHSQAFWQTVAHYLPDYKARASLLK